MKTKIFKFCKRNKSHLLFQIATLALTSISGCKKYVEVNSLKDQLISNQVFENPASANAAIAGIYVQTKASLMYAATIYNSLASDDITNVAPLNTFNLYRTDQIPPTDAALPWASLYASIYASNAAIEGLTASKGINAALRDQYIGEAEFLRAYDYFYLVNLFGDVPLILKTDVQSSSIAPRTAAEAVYTQIIADLNDAENKLPENYSISSGSKTRANKWAAAALLARVYLYKKDWANAETQSNAVITSNAYSMLDGPAGIFSQNNQEAILQWARFNGEVNQLPSYFIYSVNPTLACTDVLLNAFEAGDLRKTTWIQSSVHSGQTIYIPYKFTTTSPSTTEAYTVLRLTEQYLIRAEARAEQNRVSEAIPDINVVREKHGGLPDLPLTLSQPDCLTAILHERQVDFFTEEMHRWFDLKRMGKLDSVMTAEKPSTWKSTASLYPIPLSEIQKDPQLKQNPGY